MKEVEILDALARKMAVGAISSNSALPIIRELAQSTGATLSDSELIDLLAKLFGGKAAVLIEEIARESLKNALRYFLCRNSGQEISAELKASLKDYPLAHISGWKLDQDIIPLLNTLQEVSRDYVFSLKYRESTPSLSNKLYAHLRQVAVRLNKKSECSMILSRETFREISELIPDACSGLEPYLEALHTQFDGDEAEQKKNILMVLDEQPIRLLSMDINSSLALKMLKSRFNSLPDEKDKKNILETICCWPSIDAAGVIKELSLTPALRKQVETILLLRFGWKNDGIPDLNHLLEWITISAADNGVNQARLHNYIATHPALVLLTWYSRQHNYDSEIMELLIDWTAREVTPTNPTDLLKQYDTLFDDHEKAVIANDIVSKTVMSELFEEIRMTPEPELLTPSPEPIVPEIPLPSLWTNHIQPFFTENWYIVAGIFMVIAGSSLLAYYTWDKHWLVPYTIMPLMLAAFTAGLAKVGSWVEKRGDEFLNMAAMLRGAAIALLPVNFMTVALLSNDARVSHKVLAVPLMGLIYLFLGGWRLRRWCAAIYPTLGKLLGFTLLLLNFLVILAPLAKSSTMLSPDRLNFILGTGFYLGFAVLSYSVISFTRNILTLEMVKDKLIPCFFASTLVITFLQVFAWVHGFIGCLPHLFTYSPMVILAGGLVLYIEKYALRLKEEKTFHSSTAFIGFGLVFLGILMSLSQPAMRIVSLELAGFIWLFQAIDRKHLLHYWISFAFMVLGCASIALLPPLDWLWLPFGKWLPVIGLVAAAGMSAFIWSGNFFRNPLMVEAGTGMQTTVLALTAVAAILTQMHFVSPPATTAIFLGLITLAFLWRAFADTRLRWLHTAMLVAVLTLPYLGCVDVMHRTWQGNTMVFGVAMLSILWLMVIVLFKHPLLLKARSTVLLFYGLLALAAMILRIFIQGQLPPNVWMDFSGPIFIAGVMIIAAFYSRSLIPSGIGAIILIILFPELKIHFRHEFEQAGWGTGLGGSLSAMLLIVSCFFLRQAKTLRELKPCDLFLGRHSFPLMRFDYTLFTWPLLLSALFLLVKTDFVTVPSNILRRGICHMPLQSAIALSVTGLGWWALVIYHRSHRLALGGVHLGLICFLAGISCVYYCRATVPSLSWMLLGDGLVVQSLYLICRYNLQIRWSWVEALLTRQFYSVLKGGGLVLGVLLTAMLLTGGNPAKIALLATFTAAQLIWHGLVSRDRTHGVILYFLVWVNILAWTLPALHPLREHIVFGRDVLSTLYLLLFIQAIHLVLEFRQDFHDKLKPLLQPFLALSTLTVIIFALAGLADAFTGRGLGTVEQVLLLFAVLTAARIHHNAAFALLAMLMIYVFPKPIPEHCSFVSQVIALAEPLRLAFFGLLLAFCGGAWRILSLQYPRVAKSPFAQEFYRASSALWLFAPALAVSLFSSCHQLVDPVLRSDSLMGMTPYISSLAFFVTVWFLSVNSLLYPGIALMALGNVQMFRIHLGYWFTVMGLSQLHIVCLGLAITMIISTTIKHFLRNADAAIHISRSCVIMAGVILTLLTVNYAVSPDLLQIVWFRFAISGSMALISGLYFRHVARYPDYGEESQGSLYEGLYHFALSVTIWCAALMFPWFRTPYTALYALALPVLYFYIHAELNGRGDRTLIVRYRNSAAVLSFIILALYVFRFALQMTMFPDHRIDLLHYHYCAPAIMIISVIMMRLYGLGGNYWLAFYGGLGLMTATYFAITAVSRLSPFYYPVNGVFVAIIVAHLWIVLSYPRYITAEMTRWLLQVDEDGWHRLRRCWGWYLIVAVHVAIAWALLNYRINTYMVAPLLIGGASIFLHQGAIRRSTWYYAAAALELLLAIHADFLVPSWLVRDHVIWLLLAVWTCFLIGREVLKNRIELQLYGGIYALAFVMVFLHVIYHGVNSTVGLIGFAVAVILAALTPCRNRSMADCAGMIPAALLVWTPSWLVFFGQAYGKDYRELLSVRSALAAALSLLITGTAVQYYQASLSVKYNCLERLRPRLFDLTLHWLGKAGYGVNLAMLVIVLPPMGVITLWQLHSSLTTANFVMLLALYLGSAIAWCREGLRRNHMAPFFIMELCGMGAWAISRCQLIKTFPGFWKHEYDVWFSLLVASIASGLLQLPALKDRKIKNPLTFMLCAMPVSGLAWVLLNNMGTNTLLLVIGLYSMIFVFMGRDDRESPYHLFAIIGFVAFIMLLFWSKLEIRTVHAFVIPAGAGVLVMLQLFRAKISNSIRNQVRMVTLMAMLCSAGYYALMGSAINLCHVITFGVLALALMLLGSFLRIRLYLLLGFCGLLVDVVVIFCKLAIKMQRSTQMTIIGSLVLLGGIAIVTGAILYKTHQEKCLLMFDRMRRRLAFWE